MSIKDNFPSVGPSLSLNFARSKILDPRITFSRTSVGTYMDGNGLIVTGSADEPRFDHEYENDVVKSLGLLVEESRENLVDYSESFDSWNSGNVDIGINTTTAPDGTQNADSLIERDQNYTGGAYRRKSVSIGSAYSGQLTYSVFLKSAEVTTVGLIIDIPELSDPRANVNLTSSTTSGSGTNSTYIVESFPNDWKRVSLTTTNSLSSYTGSFVVALYLNGYVGFDNTGNSGDKVFVWGAQLEKGAFPTSYIPTSGSTLTRTADNVSMTGTNFSDWYNQEQGTMVWVGNVYSKELSPVQPFRINRTDGGNLRGMAIQFDTRSVNNTVNFMSRTQSSNIPSKVGPTGVIPSDNKIKIAGGYIESVGLSTLRAAFNGLPAASYSGASQTDIVDGAMNELEIMYNRGTSGSNIQFTGVCEQLVYYPKIFTDTQLQNLTK